MNSKRNGATRLRRYQRLDSAHGDRLTSREIAENLPAPRPGLSFTINSLEVLCLYAQIHNLRLSFRGDVVIARPQPEEEEEGNHAT